MTVKKLKHTGQRINSDVTYTNVKHHGVDGNGSDVYTGTHHNGHQTAIVVHGDKMIATAIHRTADAAHDAAKKAVSTKKKSYWDTPGDSWYNHHASEGKVVKESEVIRKGKDGRVMMSAAMFLDKAREIANKDSNKKNKKNMAGVDDTHFATARKAILKSKGIQEEKTVKITFKEYKEMHESAEAEIDAQIAELTSKLDEAAFDWGKTKPDVSWLNGKGKSTTSHEPGVTRHVGTYGSETHRAPDEKSKPIEKKSVGRPAGAYGGAYKIDKGARDSKEYKDALSAKVRAAKAQGFEDRAYFKDIMNKSLLAHAKKLAAAEAKK
jgi:hypothetical protein